MRCLVPAYRQILTYITVQLIYAAQNTTFRFIFNLCHVAVCEVTTIVIYWNMVGVNFHSTISIKYAIVAEKHKLPDLLAADKIPLRNCGRNI